MGAIFMVAVGIAMEVAFECQHGLAGERPVYYRERAALAYGAAPYLAAQLAVEALYVLPQAALFTAVTYFMMGFAASAPKFFFTLLVVELECLAMFVIAQVGVFFRCAAAAVC